MSMSASDFRSHSTRYYEVQYHNKTFNYTLHQEGDDTNSIDSFGKTFICAALFPIVTVFVVLVVWKLLHPYCEKAATESDRNSSTNNGSLSQGNNTLNDLHSIFILDIRSLPQMNSSVTDESKNEPPPSYDDEILSLPSYDEAVKNLKHPDPVT